MLSVGCRTFHNGLPEYRAGTYEIAGYALPL
jgi:hypothetical protein